MRRPSWDEVWMRHAEAIATRSLCSRRQCGTVIVDKKNRVVASSYNGPPPSYDLGSFDGQPCSLWCERAKTGETPDSYANCPSNHSEANAIAQTGRTAGGTAYVAGGSLCLTCAKLLAGARIARIVYRPDERDDYRFPDRTLAFLRNCDVAVTPL